MNRLDLDFAGETQSFLLTVDGIDELQGKCNAGPPVIYHRLLTNTYRQEDFRETLRIGLIGGGMAPAAALSLVRRYVDARPAAENVQEAQLILGSWLLGLADVVDDVNEGEAPDPKT